MKSLHRLLLVIVVAVATLLGVSAVTTAADAYPAGQQAIISLSASRINHGQTLTITGMNFPTRVTITIVCRNPNSKKYSTRSFRTKASGGTFSTSITIDQSYSFGRCRVFASHGPKSINQDMATFFVNNAAHGGTGRSTNSVTTFKLATGAGGAALARSSRLTSATVVGSLGVTDFATTGSSTAGLAVYLIGGLGLLFLMGGAVLLATSRRRKAAVA